MKTTLKKLFPGGALLLPMLIAALDVIPTVRLPAQNFANIYDFEGSLTDPKAGVILSGNVFYGTTFAGGDAGNGGIFSVNAGGTDFTNLHAFTAVSDYNETGTNYDGSNPVAALVLSGRTLYGTTQNGGAFGGGALFKINIDSTGFTNLHSFPTNDGLVAYTGPAGRLLLSDGILYGTTVGYGEWGYGTVFAIETNGLGFTNLYSFTGGQSDGGSPQAGLILSGNTLYGTASGVDTANSGCVFAINTDGSGFTNLHNFNGTTDGLAPVSELILSGSTLYGTTQYGGTNDAGTVFALNTNTTGFTNLYNFSPTTSGYSPLVGLVLSGNTLYGVVAQGGTNNGGNLFSIQTDGAGFTILHSFSSHSYPDGMLLLTNNTLYGTTFEGGTFGAGAIFGFSLPVIPQLGILQSGTNVLLTWQTNAVGFTLQSTTNLLLTAWSVVTPAPVIVNGQYIVTNAITGTEEFYRLIR